jgi:hypothetical protein
VGIAERSVTNLLDRYDELLATSLADSRRLRRVLREQGRAILALDGMPPDVGHEVLWVVRECLSGEVLLARGLLSGTADALAPLLAEVAEAIGVPPPRQHVKALRDLGWQLAWSNPDALQPGPPVVHDGEFPAERCGQPVLQATIGCVGPDERNQRELSGQALEQDFGTGPDHSRLSAFRPDRIGGTRAAGGTVTIHRPGLVRQHRRKLGRVVDVCRGDLHAAHQACLLVGRHLRLVAVHGLAAPMSTMPGRTGSRRRDARRFRLRGCAGKGTSTCLSGARERRRISQGACPA